MLGNTERQGSLGGNVAEQKQMFPPALLVGVYCIGSMSMKNNLSISKYKCKYPLAQQFNL